MINLSCLSFSSGESGSYDLDLLCHVTYIVPFSMKIFWETTTENHLGPVQRLCVNTMKNFGLEY